MYFRTLINGPKKNLNFYELSRVEKIKILSLKSIGS
jgi:hypothetical protein